jgi:DNA-binding transcriptional LysR family regulator
VLSLPGLVEDMNAFYRVADQTSVRLVKEQLSGIWEALLERRADLLIGAAGEGPSGGGYTAEPIGRKACAVVVAPQHPLGAFLAFSTRPI